MVIPISGIIHIFGFCVMFFLGYRFLKYGNKSKNQLAKFFGYSFILVSVSRLLWGIPSLIFLRDQKLWFIFEVIERSFLVAGLSVLGYAIYSIRFPEKIKKIIPFFIFVSTLIVFGFAVSPPIYYITREGFLTWESPPIIPSVLNFLFFIIIIIPAVLMLFQEAHFAKTKKARLRGIVMASALILVIIPSIFDFFITPLFKIGPTISEINYFFFYFLLLVTVFLSKIFN